MIQDERELESTKKKLTDLDRLIERAGRTAGAGRDTEIRSLARLANQLREEIVRYQSRHKNAVRHR